MKKCLLFIPDISGFTKFIQTTEVEHSQYVIAELLEVLLDANTEGLLLAEIEGDALFFYKEEILSIEKLLAQIETMFTSFYSHLKLMEKNRICPCKACSTASELELKIVAHCGEIQFITVKDSRKPFGIEVIEVHRLLKNSIPSANYTLLSGSLAESIEMPGAYSSKLFKFEKGENEYDGKKLKYVYSVIDQENLKLKPFDYAKKVVFKDSAPIHIEKEFAISATELFEFITNFKYRHQWVKGFDKLEFNEEEINQLGTEHICVVNGKILNFITVTKDGKPGQFVYGEMTTDAPMIDEFYQFYIITPLSSTSCKLDVECYWKVKSPIKKILVSILAKNKLKKNLNTAIGNLSSFVKEKML